ncbi:hypothetical protein C8Q70DRAFT_1012222 [Cubamyces menziesii]|nr:hypothetical protein C8Q70DRAFT_1012222 [Cubamyces menziesii]
MMLASCHLLGWCVQSGCATIRILSCQAVFPDIHDGICARKTAKKSNPPFRVVRRVIVHKPSVQQPVQGPGS